MSEPDGAAQLVGQSGAAGAVCPECGAEVAADDGFCEACGADLGVARTVGSTDGSAAGAGPVGDGSDRTHLIPAPTTEPSPLSTPTLPTPPVVRAPCAACGGQVGDDGWCTVCGARASTGREHVAERAGAAVAAVCDIGRHHARNEDAVALADDVVPIVVVCDGVTSATDSDAAAIAATGAARDLLAAAPGPTDPTPAGRAGYWSTQLVEAGATADAAAAATAASVGPTENPPSCTFVAAVVDREVIVVGWVGDSRAYWLADDGTAEQLTVDDSWASAQVASGMDQARAEADPRAHAITRWLGVDSGQPVTATATTTAGGSGWLLVCTDGLWNYCSGASAVSRLIATSTPADGDPLALAEALVAWANDQGGHDNITAALVRIDRTNDRMNDRTNERQGDPDGHLDR